MMIIQSLSIYDGFAGNITKSSIILKGFVL